MLNFNRVALSIAKSKAERKSKGIEETLSESTEAALKHPATNNFRLVLTLSRESSEPKKEVDSLARMMQASKEMMARSNKISLDGWEILEKYG
jgi:hypothetical protein